MARVFVSSTFKDLEECREKARTVLRRMGHEDVAMEYFVAEDKRPVDKCLGDVASCDLYIGIFAWRYGYTPEGYDKSITELEYREAVKEGKDCLIFLLNEDAPWPPKYVDKGKDAEKIASLKSELSTKCIVNFFKSADELSSLVGAAIYKWETQSRSSAPEDQKLAKPKFPKIYSPSALPYYSEIDRKLVSKNRREDINQALSYLQTHPFLLFSGLGGVGKTTLARALVDRRPFNVPEPFWFNFRRETEVTLEDLLEELAYYLNTPEIAGFKDEKRKAGEIDIFRLTDELQKRDSVWLFFDDLNFILEKNQHFKDPALEMLFKFLHNNTHEAKIIITSRILPLLNNGESLIDPVNDEKQIVEGLKLDFAIEFLKENGLLEVEHQKLEELVNSVAGHPLALKLLIESVKECGIQDTLNDLYEYKGSEERTINIAKRLFEKIAGDEKEFLERISVYRQPETKAALRHMFTEKTSPYVIRKLLDKSLLETDHNGKYWLHPLIQEFSYETLKNKNEVSMVVQLAASYYLTSNKTYENIEETIYYNIKSNESLSEELIKYLLEASKENSSDIPINLLIVYTLQNNSTESLLFFDLIRELSLNQTIEIKQLTINALVKNKDLDAKEALNLLKEFNNEKNIKLRHTSIDLLGKFFDRYLDKCIDIIDNIVLGGSPEDLEHLCYAIRDFGHINEKFTDLFKGVLASDDERVTYNCKDIAINYLRKLERDDKNDVSEILSSLESMDPYKSIIYLDDLIFGQGEFNRYHINYYLIISLLGKLYTYDKKHILCLIKKIIVVSTKPKLSEESILPISTVLLSNEGFYFESVRSLVEDDNLYVRITGLLTVTQAYSCAVFFKNKYNLEGKQFDSFFKSLEKNSIEIMKILKKDNHLKEMVAVLLQEIENPSPRQNPKLIYRQLGKFIRFVPNILTGRLDYIYDRLAGFLKAIDTQENPIHMMIFAAFMSFTYIESEKICSVWINKKDGNPMREILLCSFHMMRNYPIELLSIISKITELESYSFRDKRYLVFRTSIFLITVPNETIALYEKLLNDSSYKDKDLKIMIIFSLSLLSKWVYSAEIFSAEIYSDFSSIKESVKKLIQHLSNDEDEEVRFFAKNIINQEI